MSACNTGEHNATSHPQMLLVRPHSHCRPSRTKPSRAEPSRPELKALQLTFLNCEDAKPSACIFINGQYLVEKPLIYQKETFLGAHALQPQEVRPTAQQNRSSAGL